MLRRYHERRSREQPILPETICKEEKREARERREMEQKTAYQETVFHNSIHCGGDMGRRAQNEGTMKTSEKSSYKGSYQMKKSQELPELIDGSE